MKKYFIELVVSLGKWMVGFGGFVSERNQIRAVTPNYAKTAAEAVNAALDNLRYELEETTELRDRIQRRLSSTNSTISNLQHDIEGMEEFINSRIESFHA